MGDINVLIIEDERINCMIYDNLLSRMNMKLSFAYDGLTGIQEFVKNTYDLILLDLGLPRIGGIDVAKYIRTHEQVYQREKTPIIVITADDSPLTFKHVFDAGADEYLNKPFNITTFKELLTKYKFNRPVTG